MTKLVEIAFVVGNIAVIFAIAFSIPKIGEGGVFLGVVALWLLSNLVLIGLLMRAKSPQE